MMQKSRSFLSVAKQLFLEIFRTLRRQGLSRSYLLTLVIFFLAVFFCFLALNPILYSFVYPLF